MQFWKILNCQVSWRVVENSGVHQAWVTVSITVGGYQLISKKPLSGSPVNTFPVLAITRKAMLLKRFNRRLMIVHLLKKPRAPAKAANCTMD